MQGAGTRTEEEKEYKAVFFFFFFWISDITPETLLRTQIVLIISEKIPLIACRTIRKMTERTPTK